MPHGSLATLDDAAAIQDLANGTMLKQIAALYNVSKVAVYKRLSKHPDYKQAIELQAHSFVEDAMITAMECDADNANIARVRVDAAFKYAKAHNPAYADHATMTHELGESFEGLLEVISKRRLGVSVGVSDDESPANSVENQ